MGRDYDVNQHYFGVDESSLYLVCEGYSANAMEFWGGGSNKEEHTITCNRCGTNLVVKLEVDHAP